MIWSSDFDGVHFCSLLVGIVHDGFQYRFGDTRVSGGGKSLHRLRGRSRNSASRRGWAGGVSQRGGGSDSSVERLCADGVGHSSQRGAHRDTAGETGARLGRSVDQGRRGGGW